MNQKGNVLIILLVVIFLALVAGGAYYFYTLQQKNDQSAYNPTQVVPYTASQPSSNSNDLSSELNSIQIEETDDSFSQVDQDLKSL
jgi:flagellar basal body-associated protein FliL